MAHLYDGPCVLIGGAPRSGTTLLGEVVVSHPSVAGLLEERLTDVVQATERLASIRTPDEEGDRHQLFGEATSCLRPRSSADLQKLTAMSELPGFRRRFADIFHQVFVSVCERAHPLVVSSKLPIDPVWEDVEYLSSRLRDLRLLFIVRNPLDVVSSSLIRGQNAQLGKDVWPIRTVEAALDQWRCAMRIMAAFRTSTTMPLLIVKYETLCASPEVECDRIFEFMGLRSPGTATARLPRDNTRGRAGLSEADNAFLARELGPVDRLWPQLGPEEALANYASIPPHIKTGEHVSFAGGSLDSALISGFSFVEPWGRWTDGSIAILKVRHEPIIGEAALDLDVALARAEGAVVEVRVNGVLTITLVSKAGQSLHLDIHANVLREDGLLTVELRPLRPKTPDEPPTNDTRRLGVGLSGMTLQEKAMR